MEKMTILLRGKLELFAYFDAGYHNVSLQRAWFGDGLVEDEADRIETREYRILNPEVFFDIEDLVASALEINLEVVFRNNFE